MTTFTDSSGLCGQVFHYYRSLHFDRTLAISRWLVYPVSGRHISILSILTVIKMKFPDYLSRDRFVWQYLSIVATISQAKRLTNWTWWPLDAFVRCAVTDYKLFSPPYWQKWRGLQPAAREMYVPLSISPETESGCMFGWCRWLQCLFATAGWLQKTSYRVC